MFPLLLEFRIMEHRIRQYQIRNRSLQAAQRLQDVRTRALIVINAANGCVPTTSKFCSKIVPRSEVLPRRPSVTQKLDVPAGHVRKPTWNHQELAISESLAAVKMASVSAADPLRRQCFGLKLMSPSSPAVGTIGQTGKSSVRVQALRGQLEIEKPPLSSGQTLCPSSTHMLLKCFIRH